MLSELDMLIYVLMQRTNLWQYAFRNYPYQNYVDSLIMLNIITGRDDWLGLTTHKLLVESKLPPIKLL